MECRTARAGEILWAFNEYVEHTRACAFGKFTDSSKNKMDKSNSNIKKNLLLDIVLLFNCYELTDPKSFHSH